ncbi:gliding motility-associated-like protein [Sphingobacterium yanglingense]|uniref:Gliding motility-associated-like protein n=2 Tax=Sphingobacterium yanglingense TaxID=1437280 RepID=A0A4R6WU24_9SPHI|nr:gliding motility-associated-like protein [Sphingobacterium yanglingense]
MKKYVVILINMLCCGLLFGQNGAGSFESSNGYELVSPGNYKFIYAESLCLGPTADWQIDGEVHVYSRNVWIAPTAKITGIGTLYIHSPGDNPFYEDWTAAATKIDGNNGVFIDVNIVLDNPKGMILSDLQQTGYPDGSTGVVAKAAALKIGKSIDLRVDGASIYLNGSDLELSASGQLLNYNLHRMVVTGNMLTGHMIKNYTGVGTFVFPVGIAQGDYTPAQLTPKTASSKLYVSVNDYKAVADLKPDADLGMDRIWNIYAADKMDVNYTLTHNAVTNGSAYVDADARIVQNADKGNWIGDVTVLESAGVHSRKDIETVTGNTLSGTWFTKKAQIPPKAVDDRATMEYGSNVTINVLENDIVGSSAIDRGSVRIVAQPRDGTVTVNADGSVTYVPRDGFIGEDVFEYEIMDENGMVSQAKVMVTVLPRELMIPNVITPNGDDKNDKFVIVGREAYDRIELIVVNRWGNEVYRNMDYKDEWDGTGLNEGTYFPIIKAYRGNDMRLFKTHVLIKRY